MLSHGPFNYNRFSVLDEKKSKPDFLDMDKDGNKKESMKKASKDKDEKCDDCGKKDCGCDDKKKSGKKAGRGDRKGFKYGILMPGRTVATTFVIIGRQHPTKTDFE